MASQYVITGAICEHLKSQDCQSVILNLPELPYQQIPSASDIATVWGTAFTSVVALYFISHGIGLILNMIRRA